MRRLFVLISLFAVSLGAPAWAAFSADAPTVLITGSNRGIGLEFVRQYGAAGWNVIATARNPDQADELNALAAANERIVVERLDLLDHAGIDELAEKYASQPVDIVLNNAGLMRGPDRGQMVGTIDYAEFDRFYKINVVGPVKVSEAFYPHVKRGEQKIMVALTTGKGERGIPVPGFSLYKTSKAALDAFQQEIAIRWRRQGVKAITLLPGRVLTHGEDAAPNQDTVPVEQSVAGMRKVLQELTIEQSGRTWQWDGALVE